MRKKNAFSWCQAEIGVRLFTAERHHFQVLFPIICNCFCSLRISGAELQ